MLRIEAGNWLRRVRKHEIERHRCAYESAADKMGGTMEMLSKSPSRLLQVTGGVAGFCVLWGAKEKKAARHAGPSDGTYEEENSRRLNI